VSAFVHVTGLSDWAEAPEVTLAPEDDLEWSDVAYAGVVCVRYMGGLSATDVLRYGIDLDDINRRVADAVNMSAHGAVCVLASELDNGRVTLQCAVGGRVTLSAILAAIRQSAAPILSAALASVHMCARSF
jgi:hypothetical protein